SRARFSNSARRSSTCSSTEPAAPSELPSHSARSASSASRRRDSSIMALAWFRSRVLGRSADRLGVSEARQASRDEPRRVLDQGDDLGVGHAAGTDDAEDTEDAVTVLVGGGDEARLLHLLDRHLGADDDLNAFRSPLALGQELDQLALLLEGPEERLDGGDVAELRLVEDVHGAADVEVPVPERGEDLAREEPGHPHDAVALRRSSMVTERGADLLERAPAEALGEDARDLPQLARRHRLLEGEDAARAPVRLGREDDEGSIPLHRDEV